MLVLHRDKETRRMVADCLLSLHADGTVDVLAALSDDQNTNVLARLDVLSRVVGRVNSSVNDVARCVKKISDQAA